MGLAAFETMPEDLAPEAVLPYVTRLAKHRDFRRVLALDKFDLDTAALVREHLRLPGMTRSAVRPFRDKLAMRGTAESEGIAVPATCGVTHHETPWAFSAAHRGAVDVEAADPCLGDRHTEISDPQAVWPLLEALGDEASQYLVECFVPGDGRPSGWSVPRRGDRDRKRV